MKLRNLIALVLVGAVAGIGGWYVGKHRTGSNKATGALLGGSGAGPRESVADFTPGAPGRARGERRRLLRSLHPMRLRTATCCWTWARRSIAAANASRHASVPMSAWFSSNFICFPI